MNRYDMIYDVMIIFIPDYNNENETFQLVFAWQSESKRTLNFWCQNHY